MGAPKLPQMCELARQLLPTWRRRVICGPREPQRPGKGPHGWTPWAALPPPPHTFSLSGSVSLAWSCLLISAMVLGPFLSALEEKPWLDSRSSKWFSDTRGF